MEERRGMEGEIDKEGRGKRGRGEREGERDGERQRQTETGSPIQGDIILV